ncbi:NAD(P)-binding protein [Annulohypoxylon truncatum]|uniref:NAD(P)-binding protein n=1 Tax=Annulohypoxylon truncatum TaxID=327061 RepID=UPI0020086114|nr:NAD(P)-binding protein [Annulohypoxylon truncatum]KAI1208165.1 NAD(P)-binding protein [Annulohypoxylon truncatum]
MAAQNKGTILITGGGGFVGGQIIREALESGFSVRLTARSASSAARTVARFPAFASALSTAIVPDMTAPEAYESAFADGAAITHVVHAASPFNLAPRDNVRDLLDPAVRGATSVLEAALRYGGGKVKRVVATSSFAAVIDLSKGLREGYSYDEKDWNPVTWDEAAVAPGVVAYCASKALAERAMWDWMEEHKDEVSFGLATICPPWVFGPYAHELRDTKGLSESVQLLNGIIDGDAIPAFDFGGYADSREVAAAHVRALQVPEAEGKRFVVGQDFRYQAAVDIAREEEPELARRMPVGKMGEWIPAYHIDGSLATRVLGLKYGSLRDTVMDTYRQLLKAREAEVAAA